ncbi:MAG: nucleoside triphosphate hydrolase [Gammaproteobacteria bacterium]|nr:nucleoside triphosphate hydrolase [Gammaproteobacteria bacterium]
MDALEKVLQLEQDADAFGFKWDNTAQIMAQIRSECEEIEAHLTQPSCDDALQEEIGDLLQAVFSLTVFCKFEPRETLQKSLSKFERRMNRIKQLAAAEGRSDLNEDSFDELMRFWDKAKSQVG